MPRISFFYGIIITMYWNEADHPIAHFHASHAGEVATISVDGVVLAGTIGRRALVLVQKWCALHRDELVANWERGRRKEAFVKIEPLP